MLFDKYSYPSSMYANLLCKYWSSLLWVSKLLVSNHLGPLTEELIAAKQESEAWAPTAVAYLSASITISGEHKWYPPRVKSTKYGVYTEPAHAGFRL